MEIGHRASALRALLPSFWQTLPVWRRIFQFDSFQLYTLHIIILLSTTGVTTQADFTVTRDVANEMDDDETKCASRQQQSSNQDFDGGGGVL